MKIYGDEYPVRARVERIDGYSAHADQGELLAWASHFDTERLQKTFLVHGEKEAAFTLAGKLTEQGHRSIEVPVLGQTFSF